MVTIYSTDRRRIEYHEGREQPYTVWARADGKWNVVKFTKFDPTPNRTIREDDDIWSPAKQGASA